MKKLIAAVAIATALIPAQAVVFYAPNGVLMGTVCRNGAFYTDYTGVGSQPVGSTCPVRAGGNPFGAVIAWGIVTTE